MVNLTSRHDVKTIGKLLFVMIMPFSEAGLSFLNQLCDYVVRHRPLSPVLNLHLMLTADFFGAQYTDLLTTN